MEERCTGQKKKKLEGSALKTCEWFVAVLGMGRYLFMNIK